MGSQMAFDDIRAYVTTPPVLASPIKINARCCTSPLSSTPRALLAQENAEGKKNAMYYLNRTLVGPEDRYSPIEKICMPLILQYLSCATIFSIVTQGWFLK